MNKHVGLFIVGGLLTILVLGGMSMAGATVQAEHGQQVAPMTARFAVLGDFGTAGQAELDVANRIRSWNPDFIVTTGDNNYPNGAAATIDQNIGQYYHDFIYPYRGAYGAGAAYNKFFPALGNHDGAIASGQPYFNYFALPNNERYYTFTQGPVQFFVVDSNASEPNGITSNSVQAQWLRSGLAASTACWRVVTMHHPPYSSGAHGSTPALQWPYAQWGATTVLAGHDHDYERIMDHVTGFPYFVNGIGGTSLYPTIFPVRDSTKRFAGDFGAMRVDASTATNTLTFQMITRSNLLVDSYTINGCTPPGAAGAQQNRRTGAQSQPPAAR